MGQSGGDRRILSEKVALDKDMKWDGGMQGGAWRSISRRYFIPKAPDSAELLDLVEANEDLPAPWSALAGVATGAPERAQQIAQEIWAHSRREREISWGWDLMMMRSRGRSSRICH